MIFTGTVVPVIASSNETLTSVSRSVPRCGRVGATSRAAPTAEQPPEQVAHIAQVLDVHVPRAAGTPGPARPSCGTRTAGTEPAEPGGAHVAHLVVSLALVLITQHVVGRGDLLEAGLRVGVAGIGVGMELLGELAVGLLDLSGGGVLGHAEDAVVVLLEPLSSDLVRHLPFHRLSLAPCRRRQGRSTRTPGGTQDAPLQRVPRPQHVGHDRFAVAIARLHQGFVQLGVERRSLGVRSAPAPRPSTHRAAWRRPTPRPSGSVRSRACRRRTSARARSRRAPRAAVWPRASPPARTARSAPSPRACGSCRTRPAGDGDDRGTDRPRPGPKPDRRPRPPHRRRRSRPRGWGVAGLGGRDALVLQVGEPSPIRDADLRLVLLVRRHLRRLPFIDDLAFDDVVLGCRPPAHRQPNRPRPPGLAPAGSAPWPGPRAGRSP